jgi:hypothetical protein
MNAHARFCILAGLFGLAACAQSSSPGGGTPAGLASTRDATAGPVLAQIRFAHHRIHVHSGSDGPRFDVLTRNGHRLASHLSLPQFRERFPRLFDAYSTAVARLDASLHREPATGGTHDRELRPRLR